MKKTTSLIQKLSIFIAILICLQILGASAQVDPTKYGGKLNISVGDTFQFEYTTFFDYVQYPSPAATITLENGTYYNYNITQGLKETYTVTTINGTLYGTQVYVKMNLLFPNGTNVTSHEMPNQDFIHYSFNDVSHAKDYYSQYTYEWDINSSTGSTTYAIKGDVYYLYLNSTSTISGYNTTTAWNWKTGLLTLDSGVRFYPNGTIYYDSVKELISSNIHTNSVNGGGKSSPSFMALSILVIPIVISARKLKKR